MKPAAFTLHRPETLDEALTILAETGPEARVLAGGQSLIPQLGARTVTPAHVIDINRLAELDTVVTSEDGVRVGALARQARVERDPTAATAQPLLRQGIRLLGNTAIRSRGTVVGSLVHADPRAEPAAVLALTGGWLRLASATGERTVPAAQFLLGPHRSAIEPGELAVEAFFPALPGSGGTALVEIARPAGGYAVCGVAAWVVVDFTGAVSRARVACLGMGPAPVVADVASAAPPTAIASLSWAWAGAADIAVAACDPAGDVHSTAAYRRHVARVLATRALSQAASAARRSR